MPELPEVETVMQGLIPALEGAVLKEVTVRRRDLRIPIPDDLVERTQSLKIKRLKRRSKYILIEMETGDHMILHLGMSGCVRIFEGNPVDLEKHDHVEFVTDSRKWIRFNDPRRFGFLDLIREGEMESYPSLARLGLEPFDEKFDGDYLKKCFANRKTTLKAALMDQRHIAGLGNIYVNEALFRSQLSPKKQAGSLTKPKADLLASIIKDVLREAIEAGGSSLRDHRQTDGELGYFQHSFKVYGREGETCSQCGQKEIERIVQQNRSTFYCPACQR